MTRAEILDYEKKALARSKTPEYKAYAQAAIDAGQKRGAAKGREANFQAALKSGKALAMLQAAGDYPGKQEDIRRAAAYYLGEGADAPEASDAANALLGPLRQHLDADTAGKLNTAYPTSPVAPPPQTPRVPGLTKTRPLPAPVQPQTASSVQTQPAPPAVEATPGQQAPQNQAGAYQLPAFGKAPVKPVVPPASATRKNALSSPATFDGIFEGAKRAYGGGVVGVPSASQQFDANGMAPTAARPRSTGVRGVASPVVAPQALPQAPRLGEGLGGRYDMSKLGPAGPAEPQLPPVQVTPRSSRAPSSAYFNAAPPTRLPRGVLPAYANDSAAQGVRGNQQF